MTLFLLVLLCALAWSGPATAESVELPEPASFQALELKAALPVELRDALHLFLAAPAPANDREGSRQLPLDELLADPGEPYQVTDVVVLPARLAARRLILAGDGTTPFVAYEHGGIARHGHLVFFERVDGKLRAARNLVFSSVSPRPEKLDVGALWQEVRAGRPMAAREKER